MKHDESQSLSPAIDSRRSPKRSFIEQSQLQYYSTYTAHSSICFISVGDSEWKFVAEIRGIVHLRARVLVKHRHRYCNFRDLQRIAPFWIVVVHGSLPTLFARRIFSGLCHTRRSKSIYRMY